MPTLDSCINGIYEPGNIGSSSGTPPTVITPGSLEDPATYNPDSVIYSLDYSKFYNSMYLLLLMVGGGGGAVISNFDGDGSDAPGGSEILVDALYQNAAGTAGTYMPNILDQYHAIGDPDGRDFNNSDYQPPWNVAGVDYRVGPHTVPTKAPTVALAGCSISLVTKTFTIDDPSIIVDGYDFTDWQMVINGNDAIVQNCHFHPGTTTGGNQILAMSGVVNFTFQYNTVDGRQTGSSSLVQFRGSGALKILYNAFYTFMNHPVECANATGSAAFTVDYRYNVICQGTVLEAGQHLNFLQFGGGHCTSAIVEYNTTYQTPQISGGEGFQFYMQNLPFDAGDVIVAASCSYNTMICTEGAAGDAISYFMHGEDLAGQGPGPGGSYVGNYFDATAAFGFFYKAGDWSASGNRDMLTGLTANLDNTTGP